MKPKVWFFWDHYDKRGMLDWLQTQIEECEGCDGASDFDAFMERLMDDVGKEYA